MSAAAAPTTKAVLAHLKARPAKVSDGAIAERATKILRSWGADGTRDRVSRPLVNMVRNGRISGAFGFKALAIWEAMAALRLIPAVPLEAQRRQQARAEARHRRDANRSPHYWRRKYEALEARVRGRSLPDADTTEVPMLTKPILQFFALKKNPVFDEIESDRDIWWSTQHREAKSTITEAVERQAFIRLAGPRGSGKSLVATAARGELAKREDVVLVEPSPTITGVLTETHLLTAVIQSIKRKLDARDEIFTEALSPAKRALAMRYLLIQQKKAGRKVVLWIDEAHELKAGTFLALKRFLDEADGTGRRLLGVVLVGQNPEAAYNPRARDLSEVTLRLQTFRMQPMNREIPDYLRFKIERAGARPGEVITPAGLKAIAERCPYPLDANALFAQLLIEAYENRQKPIGRDDVQAVGFEGPAPSPEPASA